MNKKRGLKLTNRLINATVLLTVFLVPWFYNPFTANIFDLNKHLILVISSAILLILWTIKNMLTRSLQFTVTPATLPIIVFGLLVVGSTLSGSLPRMAEIYVNIGGFLVSLVIFFLAATTITSGRRMGDRVIYALIASAVMLSVLAVLEQLGFGVGRMIAMLSGSEYDDTLFVIPSGSAVSMVAFLLPMLLTSVIMVFAKRKLLTRGILITASSAIITGLVIGIFTIMPGKPNSPSFLPFNTSWLIAAESIKNPRQLLFGVGVDNYVAAFSQFRGVGFNQFEFWNSRFANASNYPLHLFSTLGLLGLLVWIWLIGSTLKTFKQAKRWSLTGKAAAVGVVVIFLIQLFIPNNTVLMSSLFFLLIAMILDMKANKDQAVSELLIRLFAAKLVHIDQVSKKDQQQLRTEALPFVLGVPVILFACFIFFASFRVVRADMLYRNSLLAASANDGARTYELQNRAIANNPYFSLYRRVYANTNLTLANSIGSQEDLSEEDQQTVAELVRQAIRQGQAAVQINPLQPANWEVLANIYRNLINVAEGSRDWSVSSYAQAINLDPVNPRLWLEVGGIFYQLEEYPEAIDAFQRAVQLKPDWSNAHYNLANAYVQNQEIERAITQYQAVLQLLDPTSNDYTTVESELNQLREQVGEDPETSPVQTEEISAPEPLPSPLPGVEDLELTGEDAPPLAPEPGSESEAETEPTTDESQGDGGEAETTDPTPEPSPEE